MSFGVSPEETWTFHPHKDYGLPDFDLRVGLYQVQVNKQNEAVTVLRAGAAAWEKGPSQGVRISGMSLDDLANCGVRSVIWTSLFKNYGTGYFEKMRRENTRKRKEEKKKPKFPGVVLNSILMGQACHLLPKYEWRGLDPSWSGWTPNVPCLKIEFLENGQWHPTVFNVQCKRYLEEEKYRTWMEDIESDEKEKAVEVADGVKIVYRWSEEATLPPWVGWGALDEYESGWETEENSEKKAEKEQLLEALSSYRYFMPQLYYDVRDYWTNPKKSIRQKQEKTRRLVGEEQKRKAAEKKKSS